MCSFAAKLGRFGSSTMTGHADGLDGMPMAVGDGVTVFATRIALLLKTRTSSRGSKGSKEAGFGVISRHGSDSWSSIAAVAHKRSTDGSIDR